ncbi:sensor histidine kinase [Siccirubricoccus sp. G192]|uniref:sensor histidine kinase n=1 Tax=Siccirubricoccus sp. G192 TaxID=2849651 RepID=UPI001C2C8515|nr:sensor histidine kinase [Siccirubricoccus sp. G192]MBV1800523.1 sensor histidine kinase [Siccirubricoccus sp. G192]
MRPSRSPTLRGRLLLLVGFVTLALLAFAILAVWQDYKAEREHAEEQLRDQATALALAVDREFDRAEAAMSILATSAALARGDLETFEAEMRAASARLGGEPIALTTPDGRQVLNTLWAPGERRSNIQGSLTTRRVFTSGNTEVSNLHQSSTTGRPVIITAVPVFTARQGPPLPTYALGISLRRDHLARMLSEQSLRQGWSGGVLDRRGNYVARTQRDAETAGQPAQPRVRAALAEAESGIIHGGLQTLEGVPWIAAFARAPATGYAIVVGVPEEAFAAPLRAALLRTLGTGALIAAAGLLLALLLGRRVVASLRVLEMLGQGGPAGAVPKAGLREVDDIARVLADGARRQALLIAELNHRVKNTLATVQSVAVQTLRSAEGDTARFTHDFGQRLQALAAAHNLLTAHSWGATDLAAIVQAALGPWLGDGGSGPQIAPEGPGGIPVAPRQAQAIMLALHELATNAVKYGALSRAGGRVALGWSREPDGVVVIHWTETGGPAVAGPPQRRGFGTRLLERALAYDLGPGATVVLRFEPAGLHAVIRFTPGAVLPETVERHAADQRPDGA